MDIKRVVVWFSAGVTSAVAGKMALDKYRDVLPVVFAYCDTGSEDPDNMRFLRDVEKWLGIEVKILKNDKYENTFDVYRKTGYLVGNMGARCSLELKKKVRQDFEDVSGDLQVFGYDSTERERADRFVFNNPEVLTWFPLIDNMFTKDDCHELLMRHGIKRPATYDLGFKNANCLQTGCVKGGMGYWNHYRKVYPDRYQRMAELERELDVAINKTYVDGQRTRVFLDELPEDAGNYNAEPSFQCGLFCGIYEEDNTD